MKKKIFIFIGIILILTIILVFVFQRTKDSESLEDTSLRLKWICQAQFAGYYTANAEGYYKDEGLNVTIDPAGPNISPIQSVASGINEFGIAGAEQVISAIDNGVPIVAIAVIYRETPEALTSKKSLNITEKNGKLQVFKLAVPNTDVIIVSTSGTIMRMPIDQITVLGRATQGLKLINLKDGQAVSTISIIDRIANDL